MVEFTSQNGTECIYICLNSKNLKNRSAQLPQKHYCEICVEKQYRMHIHICKLSKLPKLVSLVTTRTLQLNLCQKTVQNAYTYLLILKITKTG